MEWPCNVKGSIRIDVESVSENSKQISTKTLFCARKGEGKNGMHFIREAIANGAVCIAVEDERYFDSYDEEVPIIWVPNILKFIAYAAATFSGHPSEVMTVIAVTGTNGKTTTTHFIHQLLQRFQKQSLLIGTNGVFLGTEKLAVNEDSLTTMRPIPFQQLLSRSLEEGIEYIVLEASSQGLASYRLDYTNIDIGVFLNLGEDHIEAHGSVERYKQAKMRLIDLSDMIIVNGQDPFCRSVGIISKKPSLQFNLMPKTDIFYEKLLEREGFSNYFVQFQQTESIITFPFTADFLIENAMAAVSVCLQIGLSLQQIAKYTLELTLPEGRMQTYYTQKGVKVIIDYAHTADALEALLKAVSNSLAGELHLVFSCGGNRDKMKRVKMGAVASKYADYVYLTTDNCRNENPIDINLEIIEGFHSNQRYEMLLDRQEAIQKAITLANEGDTVVIAGKGHERVQIIGAHSEELSDIEVVEGLIID